MKHIAAFFGFRPLCFVDKKILFAKKNDVYLYDSTSNSMTKIASIPTGLKGKIIFSNRLLTRIFRYGFRCAIPFGFNQVMCVFNKAIFLLEISAKKFTLDHKITKGSGALMLTNISNILGFDDMVCYGEYWSNSTKDEVRIFGKHILDKQWNILYTFHEGAIEHIHTLIPDPFRNVVWILTGDFGHSPGFWIARNNFQEVKPMAVGQQVYRATIAFPTPEGLIYGTDSQIEENSIRILRPGENNTWVSEFLFSLSGPCIYSCQVGKSYIFSTSVEPGKPCGNLIVDMLERKPGPGIKGNSCDIVCGNIENGFTTVAHWAKDKWPLRLAQFGVITFPAGLSHDSKLYTYGIGVVDHDDVTDLFDINQ